MSTLSQAQKVFALLKQSPLKKFTARDIAEGIIHLFPKDYILKRQNPRFKTEDDFINQVFAEIGASKNNIQKVSPFIHIQDKPRPRVYWYDPNIQAEYTEPHIDEEITLSDTTSEEIEAIPVLNTSGNLSEHDLYPRLIHFLKHELGLYCLRINEKRSKNQRGQNGNQWLHPDIVAMHPIDKRWNELIKTCVKHGSGQNVRLWSFEVKKELNSSNIRSSFFQAVSNSSWANEGYLVATSIANNEVEEELRMLSALHGIGVILLIPENPTESNIFLPARRKAEVDWQSTNRLLNENRDFEHFIKLVANYYQTGTIFPEQWNRI